MDIKINVFSNDIIRELYTLYGYTAKDIGNLVGLTESAILLRLKGLNIRSFERGVKDPSIKIIYTGKMFNLKSILTEDVIKVLIDEGHTDRQIGEMFGITGEGVAYKRKKFGIPSLKERHANQHKLLNTSKEILTEEYYKFTQEQFSELYGVSKTTWRAHLKNLGIPTKKEIKESNYPKLTEEQIRLIIAGLLGDGSVSQGNYYYESHSTKQLLYLKKKANILKPYSLPLVDIDTEPRLKTVRHSNFNIFYDLFYKDGVKGKHIPVDFIKEHWDDSIIAYWFFDDGSYDEVSRTYWIGNLCPDRQQLEDLIIFLNNRYGWGFGIREGSGVYIVTLPASCRDEFVTVLLKYATPDLFYKIPEPYLTNGMIKDIPLEENSIIRPKFYRTCEDEHKKREIEQLIFNRYRKKGFPYLRLSSERKDYLLESFKRVEPKVIDGVIEHNPSGLILCECFFDNIYSCFRKGHRSPSDLWEEDTFLYSLIRNRLKYADIISDASMRTGLKLAQNSVSNFKPVIAKWLYKKYCFNNKLLDYCAGFGSRMLSAMCSGIEYTGYEPATETYNNLCEFRDYLKDRTTGISFLHNIPFEESSPAENYYSFSFSSPPYYDFEWYSSEETQSIVKYPSYQLWLNDFWKKSIEKACNALVIGGYFGVCVSSYLHPEMITTTFDKCKEMGFYLVEDYKAVFPNILKGGERYESIFIFSKKGNNLKAKFWPVSDGNLVPVQETSILSNIHRRSRRSIPIFKWKEIEEKFKEVSLKMGLSRETYKDSYLLGAPSHVIERHYGTWNNFIKVCGLVPQYVVDTPLSIVFEYFKECMSQDKILSFYEYGKIRGNKYTLKMKRLFNAGKKYNHLLDELKQVALNKDAWDDFLKKFN